MRRFTKPMLSRRKSGFNPLVRASHFVVLVLSEAVLSETVLVLEGCLNCDDTDETTPLTRSAPGVK